MRIKVGKSSAPRMQPSMYLGCDGSSRLKDWNCCSRKTTITCTLIWIYASVSIRCHFPLLFIRYFTSKSQTRTTDTHLKIANICLAKYHLTNYRFIFDCGSSVSSRSFSNKNEDIADPIASSFPQFASNCVRPYQWKPVDRTNTAIEMAAYITNSVCANDGLGYQRARGGARVPATL